MLLTNLGMNSMPYTVPGKALMPTQSGTCFLMDPYFSPRPPLCPWAFALAKLSVCKACPCLSFPTHSTGALESSLLGGLF